MFLAIFENLSIIPCYTQTRFHQRWSTLTGNIAQGDNKQIK